MREDTRPSGHARRDGEGEFGSPVLDPTIARRRAPRRPAAVALSYEDGKGLPRVVATGRDAVAERILDLAFAAGVKVRQDADLVEILAAVDLDCEIPMEAIVAVAEILARVYEANGTTPPDSVPEPRIEGESVA